MDTALKEKLAAKDKWLKLIYLILFVIINYFVQFISGFIALFQFVVVLLTDKPNQRLQTFGKNLAMYSAQIVRFLAYSAEEKPFPFNDWPDSSKN